MRLRYGLLVAIILVQNILAFDKLYDSNREPFRTLIKEADYLEDFMQFEMVDAEEQKLLDKNVGTFLLVKIVASSLNYTKSLQNSSSEEYQELKDLIINGVSQFRENGISQIFHFTEFFFRRIIFYKTWIMLNQYL